jgi:hypothetical protein
MAKSYYIHFPQSEWDLDAWIDYYLDQGFSEDEAEEKAALSIAEINEFEEAPVKNESQELNDFPF